MTVTGALHEAMEVLDAHKERMGSGPYCDLAGQMKSVANSMDEHELRTKRDFAMELMLDVPACASAGNAYHYTQDKEFMATLVRRKGLELQAYERCHAAVLGHAWKIEITEALLPYHAEDARSLLDVRQGVFTLLRAQSGFLPQIVHRLNWKGVTPQMLCPKDLGTTPLSGDDGCGPSAFEFLKWEPRMLRWMLGLGELEPWPRSDTPGHRTKRIRALICAADNHGGDDVTVNDPCTCDTSKGVRIPTMERPGLSLTSSECSSDLEDEMVS